jgi:acyl-CoA synthetase (AMP-forming)/AMP-acid ligase II
MTAAMASWGKEIAVETIRGVPFRLYTSRPRRIESFLDLARRWGSRAHVVQGGNVLTFDGLMNASAAKAHVLAVSGVARGERVFLLGWNTPEWIVNFWACQRIGAIPVLANAWWSEGELSDALDRLQPALTLADAHGAARMPAAWRCGPWDIDVNAPRAPDATALAAAGTASLAEVDPALIIFTSGTGGRPKAVVHSHRALIAGAQMVLHISRRLPQQVDEHAGDIALQTGPLFHIGGAGMLLRSAVIGNTLVMPRGKFDPAEALELIERHRITRWSAVPTMVSRVLDHPDRLRRDLGSLGALTLGGAPIHAELLQRIGTALPGVQARVPTGYGLTESGSQVTAASGADTARHPGSCGRPLPCVELKIVPRPGLPDGEVLVRTPTQMAGYYGDEASPIDDEGWLHTGDLGRIDDNGHLWITGRSKDMIIRGGENIAPAAVESALMAIAGVVEAVVFGVPHRELGEEVMAVVVVDADLTPRQLQRQLRASVASFAVPSRWHLQREPLPINNTGKIDKAAVVAQVREYEK